MKDSIIEKIKKLLRMKRGGTPDEIATALRLAQELAEKHGIDLDDVNPEEEQLRESPITHQDEVHGARVSWESRYAAMICDSFFRVRAFKAVNNSRTKYVIRFVGEEWDIQIAIYVYRFLCGHFRREWNAKRGRLRKRRAFMWGMYLGLAQKLRERQPKEKPEAALMRFERALLRRDQYIAARWEVTSNKASPDDDSAKARYRGWLAGRDTEIHSGVKGGVDRDGLGAGAGPKLLC